MAGLRQAIAVMRNTTQGVFLEIILTGKEKIYIYKEILYIEKDNDKYMIDLMKCNKNYKKKNDKSEYKPVGERDICGEPPYFIFFADNKAIIKIKPKLTIIDKIFNKKKDKEFKIFHNLYNILTNEKWSTLDLS